MWYKGFIYKLQYARDTNRDIFSLSYSICYSSLHCPRGNLFDEKYESKCDFHISSVQIQEQSVKYFWRFLTKYPKSEMLATDCFYFRYNFLYYLTNIPIDSSTIQYRAVSFRHYLLLRAVTFEKMIIRTVFFIFI